ncbi:MAG: hypothetical protein ABL932_11105, partial [Terricaulis sp.]
EDLVREGPSQQYQQERQRRRDIRAPYTDERWRREGVPEALVPLARGVEQFNHDGPAAVFGQMFRNMGVQDDLAYWQNRWRGRDAAQAAYDDTQVEQQRVEREQPNVNSFANVASVPAFGGNPVANAPRMTAFQGARTAATLNAPFAFARQEGNFQERLLGAARETAIVGAFGGALQTVANRFARPPAPNSSQARAQEFQAANVRAPLAAVQGRGNAPMAQAIAENPVGGNVRRNLQNSVDDVEREYRGMVAQAGTAEPREVAGEIVQRGVRRFANGRNEPMPNRQVRDPATGRMVRATPRQIRTRDWSFGAKSGALYDDVFGRLARDEEALLQGGVRGHLDTSATRDVLRDITRRVSGAASREAMSSPMIGRIRQALVTDARNGTLRFQDLRAWRTWVREAQQNEGLRQGLDNAALQRLERALTTDIYASAQGIGGQAARDLHSIDRWYRQTSNRINTALEPFNTKVNGVATQNGASAFRRVIDLASQGGRQNTRQLMQLRESLRPDEWRSVSASIMHELGNVNFGSPHINEPGAFSLENFVRNVGRMSPEGRQALFGPQLGRELENLARVAGYIKSVRSFANMSRSGSSIQNVSTLGAVGGAVAAAATGNIVPLTMIVGAGLAVRVTGEMLSNPAFVRWLTSPGTGGLSRQLQALATIAARDPAVAPLYEELVQRVAGRSRSQEPQPAQSSQRTP